MYKPDSATAEEKAPAIVFAHGLSTTKECYTQYAIELSRRGYVVVTPDMLNHGGSDITPFEHSLPTRVQTAMAFMPQ